MLKLLITADYEVFGDGGGCIRKCLIEPAGKLMRICESVGARVTFFVDYCEYRAFHAAEKTGVAPEGYTPGTWMATQLKEAVRRGHDVQLHLHPQWLDAEYISPEKWKVNLDYWRLPRAPGGYGCAGDPASLLGMFSLGRKTFETLLKPERSDYTCRAFRAGAWSVQPEAEVLRAMNEAGIWRDASVLPGLETDNGLTRFDFTRAPEHLPCWKVKDRVDAPDETGRIIEMPVYTQKIAFWRRALFKMVKTVRPFGRNYPGCAGAPAIGHPERASIKKWRLYLKETRPIIEKFDFCRASAMKMKYFMKSARKKYKALPGKKEPTPIIAVGHPKGFANENEFGRFMRWVQERDFVELDRLSEPSPWWRSPDGMNGRGQ